MRHTVPNAARGCGLVVLAMLLAAAAAEGAPHRTIRLTFDADMTPGMLVRLDLGAVSSWYDPAILAYLRENRIPAVVFVTGVFAEAYPELVASLAHDPLFVVGVHGYDHEAYRSPCYGLPALRNDGERRADLEHARTTVARIAGTKPRLFRYPGLCHAAHDDELVREVGLTVDTPTVVSGDAFSHNAAAVVEQVLRKAKDGSEVVFHLGGPNAPVTLEALEQLVPALRKRGYEFVR